MKKIIAFVLSLTIVFSFCSCSIEDKRIENSTTNWENSYDYEEIHIQNAEKSMRNYLDYFDSSMSTVEYKGFIEVSGQTYIVYQSTDTPNYSCYIAVNENYNIYGGYDNSDMELIWENTSVINKPNYGADKLYLPGYENESLYIEIMKYESCTNPEELCVLLENLYNEKISYYFLDYKEGPNVNHENGFYYEPYNNYLCAAHTLYMVEKSILPIESDTYIFWGQNSLKTLFIMDKNGSYLVAKHESKLYDDGTTGQSITAWILSDLYLCSHGYINAGDEDKSTYKLGAYGISVYKEFEELLITTI